MVAQRTAWTPGHVFDGKYRVERVLADTAMGVVLAAQHLQITQRVAIKVLPAGASDELVQRFAQEARAAAQIRSEHVVRVYDIDRLASGEWYIVMELLRGQDLAALAAEQGPSPAPEAVGYMLQACVALVQAHGLGIIHRDLKPENLFVTRRADGSSCVKVLDFGISKLRAAPGTSFSGITTSDAIMGSPAFMPPEQWVAAKHADTRSDIWALGAILYELLAGRPAFAQRGMAKLCRAIMEEEPQGLGELRPELAPELATVVHRCLRKLPDERYQSIPELAVALGPFADATGAELVARVQRITTAMSQPPPEPAPPRREPSARLASADTIRVADHSTSNQTLDGLGPGPSQATAPHTTTRVAADGPENGPVPQDPTLASDKRNS